MGAGLEAVPVDARPTRSSDLNRSIASPIGFSGHNWWRATVRLLDGASASSFGVIAGGCAFYAMLALFPGLSVFVSIYGLGADYTLAEQNLSALRPMLPPEIFKLIADRVHELVSAPQRTLGWSLFFGLALALWSASAGSKAMLTALNIAYYEDEKRGLIRFNVVALVFTVGTIIGLALALATVVAVPVALALLPMGKLGTLLLPLVTWSIYAMVVLGALAVLFRFGPSRRQARWRWITPGSLFAGLLLLLNSFLFSLYVRHFGSYDVTYGSIGAVVVVLFWLYLSAYVILVGARLNAELELETAHDTTVGGPRPPGRRGAFVADNVAT